MTEASFEGWAIVELLGYRVLSGYARAVPMLDTVALRLDVALPDGEPPYTELFFAHSIYGIVPTVQEDVEGREQANLDGLRGVGLHAWPRAEEDMELVPWVRETHG